MGALRKTMATAFLVFAVSSGGVLFNMTPSGTLENVNNCNSKALHAERIREHDFALAANGETTAADESRAGICSFQSCGDSGDEGRSLT